MTTLEEVRAVIELRREEARSWRGQSEAQAYGSQAPDRNASALEHIWHRLGLHSVAASTTF